MIEKDKEGSGGDIGPMTTLPADTLVVIEAELPPDVPYVPAVVLDPNTRRNEAVYTPELLRAAGLSDPQAPQLPLLSEAEDHPKQLQDYNVDVSDLLAEAAAGPPPQPGPPPLQLPTTPPAPQRAFPRSRLGSVILALGGAAGMALMLANWAWTSPPKPRSSTDFGLPEAVVPAPIPSPDIPRQCQHLPAAARGKQCPAATRAIEVEVPEPQKKRPKKSRRKRATPPTSPPSVPPPAAVVAPPEPEQAPPPPAE